MDIPGNWYSTTAAAAMVILFRRMPTDFQKEYYGAFKAQAYFEKAMNAIYG